MPRSGWPATISAISAPSSTMRNPGAVRLKGAAVWPGSSTRRQPAHAFVIHDLRITENTGSRGWREPAGLSVVKQERNVVKGCLSHVRGLLGSRPLLRIGGEIGLSTLGTRGVGFSPGSWFAISDILSYCGLREQPDECGAQLAMRCLIDVLAQIIIRESDCSSARVQLLIIVASLKESNDELYCVATSYVIVGPCRYLVDRHSVGPI